MAKPKRNKAQRENDLVFIAKQYLKGKTQQEITDALAAARPYSLSRVQIRNDLRKIRDRWLESALIDYDKALAKELAKVDNLELEYWDAWVRSLAEKTTSTTRAHTDDEGKETRTGSFKREQMVGDPRFLVGVQWCIEKRVELLRLKPPERLVVKDWRIEAKEIGIDPNKLITELEDRYYEAIKAGAELATPRSLPSSETESGSEQIYGIQQAADPIRDGDSETEVD